MKNMENFRLAHPMGKVDVNCMMQEGNALLNVKIYEDRMANVEHCLAQYQTVCLQPDAKSLKQAVEEALEFTLMCAGFTENKADAQQEVTPPSKKTRKVAAVEQEDADMGTVKQVDALSVSKDVKKETPEDEKMKAAVEAVEEATDTEEKVEVAAEKKEEVAVEEKSEVTVNLMEKTEDVEKEVEDEETEEFTVHTMQEAKMYQIPSGRYKGAYIGELLAIDKSAVEYFATKYKGTDANARTAARIVLGLEQAVDF